jgi:hypothetical protein
MKRIIDANKNLASNGDPLATRNSVLSRRGMCCLVSMARHNLNAQDRIGRTYDAHPMERTDNRRACWEAYMKAERRIL